MKHDNYITHSSPFKVTPFVGVWIETSELGASGASRESHPSWVCGLKQDIEVICKVVAEVTPFVGVWIET